MIENLHKKVAELEPTREGNVHQEELDKVTFHFVSIKFRRDLTFTKAKRKAQVPR